jgi:hypothetical protein
MTFPFRYEDILLDEARTDYRIGSRLAKAS